MGPYTQENFLMDKSKDKVYIYKQIPKYNIRNTGKIIRFYKYDLKQ